MSNGSLIVILLSVIAFFLGLIAATLLFGSSAVLKTTARIIQAVVALALVIGVCAAIEILERKHHGTFLVVAGLAFNLLFGVLGIQEFLKHLRAPVEDFGNGLLGGIFFLVIGLLSLSELFSVGFGIAAIGTGTGKLYSIWVTRKQWKSPESKKLKV